jgi:DNA-binding CsgD family transcriptional regulator/PAS domain-containing protein
MCLNVSTAEDLRRPGVPASAAATNAIVALGHLELPILVVDLDDLTVSAVSPAALAVLGRSRPEVIGQPAASLFGPDDELGCRAALEAVRVGPMDFYRAHRRPDPADASGTFTIWVNAVELGGERVALVQLAKGDEPQHSPLVEYLGGEPLQMAIGTTDVSWVITSISNDVEGLLGISSDELLGRPLLGAVQQDDVPRLLEADLQRDGAHSVALRIWMRDSSGEWTRLCCVLTSLAGATDRWFILVSDREPDADGAARVSELERHLWRIAAEVEASGILQRVGPIADPARFPQMGALSTRQWEVLSRLLNGDRVPTIATELFVSQSTVRDHLSAIFERFGVHSQAELLALLRSSGKPSG